MDLSNAEYVGHIARRIEAVVKATGGAAGIYLDNLRFEAADKKAWTSLLTEVRKTCGDVPIVVNAGWDSDDLEWVCPLCQWHHVRGLGGPHQGQRHRGLLRPHRRFRADVPQAAP